MSGYHYVRPYRRSNGTYVRGHRRRNPSRPMGIGAVIVFVIIVLSLTAHSHGQTQGTSTPANVSTVQPGHTAAPKLPSRPVGPRR